MRILTTTILLLYVLGARSQGDTYTITDSITHKSIVFNEDAIVIIIGDTYFGKGTGFVVNKPNYIITCAHVVKGLKKIEALGDNGGRVRLSIVQIDTNYDLALLKGERNLCSQPLHSGNIIDVKCADRVFCLGFKPIKHDMVASVNIYPTYIRAMGKMLYNRTALDFIEYLNYGEPGNSGGPIIDENTGLVIAMIREGFYISAHNGPGTLIGRGISFTRLLNYIK